LKKIDSYEKWSWSYLQRVLYYTSVKWVSDGQDAVISACGKELKGSASFDHGTQHTFSIGLLVNGFKEIVEITGSYDYSITSRTIELIIGVCQTVL
jgi:hypothetical protein